MELETLLGEIIESPIKIAAAAITTNYQGDIEILQDVIAAQALRGEFSPGVKAVIIRAAELIHVGLEMSTGTGLSDELIAEVKSL